MNFSGFWLEIRDLISAGVFFHLNSATATEASSKGEISWFYLITRNTLPSLLPYSQGSKNRVKNLWFCIITRHALPFPYPQGRAFREVLVAALVPRNKYRKLVIWPMYRPCGHHRLHYLYSASPSKWASVCQPHTLQIKRTSIPYPVDNTPILMESESVNM